MRKPRSFLIGVEGKSHFYHVVTRTAGQELLFGDAEKETFRQILLKQLKFSGLRSVAWCFMGNHLHLLLAVPDKETTLAGWTEAMILDRLQEFRDEYSTHLLLGEIETFRRNGNRAGIAAITGRVRARLFDLSMFMKELKQRMTIAYNFTHERSGTLWEGRFKSVIVEGGEALRMVAAYIDLNPVRAGIVDDPKDYRWCSYAAATAGMRSARSGLIEAVAGGEGSATTWQAVSESYRKLLFGIGDRSIDPKGGSRAGISQEEARAVWEAGGKLTLVEALRCRVRYFSAGVALGSKQFIDEFFLERRQHFGVNRSNGARLMRGAEWGEVHTLRALRVDPITLPRSRSSRI